ncbi:MAG: hypothetical protein ACXWQO_03910 [Bdellovibrionota bacterium]
MNLRLFTIALLAAAIPLAAAAGAKEISLDKGDFLTAKRLDKNGEELVSLKLSKSGKAKLRKLSKTAVGQKVHSELGGVTSDFVLRDPIAGDKLQMGPFSHEDALKVLTAINQN